MCACVTRHYNRLQDATLHDKTSAQMAKFPSFISNASTKNAISSWSHEQNEGNKNFSFHCIGPWWIQFACKKTDCEGSCPCEVCSVSFLISGDEVSPECKIWSFLWGVGDSSLDIRKWESHKRSQKVTSTLEMRTHIVVTYCVAILVRIELYVSRRDPLYLPKLDPLSKFLFAYRSLGELVWWSPV